MALAPVVGQGWPTATDAIRSQTFADDAGLLAATQNDIAFAPDGTAWLATSVGLVSFDGVVWSRHGTREGLPSSCVTAVQWSQGLLWVGTDRGAGTWQTGRFTPAAPPLRDAFVRRIVERIRGELWVCTATATLRRQGNEFTPVDLPAVIDLATLSGGQLLAVTPHQLFRVTDTDKQTLPLPPGASMDASSFAEMRDGRVLAATARGMWLLTRDRWSSYASDRRLASDCALLTTSDGEIVTVGPGARLWRVGRPMLPWSTGEHAAHGTIKRIVEAPDRAIWAVGDGCVLRWPRGRETLYDLPPAACEDAGGGVWVAGVAEVACYREGRWVRRRDLMPPIVRRQRGDVLVAQRTGGAIAIIGDKPAAAPLPHPGILPVQLVVDGRDVAWLLGRQGDAAWLAWLTADNRWQPVEIGDVAFDAGLVPDPRNGVWLLGEGPVASVVRVHAGDRHVVPLPEPLACRTLAVTADGRAWVVGRTSLWSRRDEAAWQATDSVPTHGSQWLAAIDDRLVLGCRGSHDAAGGIVVVDVAAVSRVAGSSTRLIGRDARGLYVVVGDRLLVLAGHGPPIELPAFDESYSTSVLVDSSRRTWFGGAAGLRCVEPSAAPHLVLGELPSSFVEGAPSALSAELRFPFVSREAAPPRLGSVQWRLADDSWSAVAPLHELVRLSALVAGTHRVDLLARDAMGRTATLSNVVVQVTPQPWQERWWFVWLAVAIATLIVLFGAQAFVATRRLAARADRLRGTVVRRTHKMRTELRRRARAEQRLVRQTKVLELLATGRPLADALKALVDSVEQELPGWRGAVSIVHGEGEQSGGAGSPQSAAAVSSLGVDAQSVTSIAALRSIAEADSHWLQAEPIGIAAAHAHPIASTDGTLLGVLALMRAEPAELTAEQLGVVESAAQMAAFAIHGKRGEVERHELQQQLLNAQKLRSLGLLAGGIAHDFNNLLTGILGNAGLARMTTTIGSTEDVAMVQVELAAQRAAELCAQLLAYSGHGRFLVKPVNLSVLTQEMVQMLRLPLSRKIALELALGSDLPAVEADATQLRQVLMNLITNAAEAVGDRVGRIDIRTGVLVLSGGRIRAAAVGQSAKPGRYVFFEVSDTGCGLNESTRKSMFDPFFTTKSTGRGLGLAAVLGIVHSHHGAIEIESEPDRGTCMRVFFPASTKAVAAPMPPTLAVAPRLRGGGLILIADDEPIVRELACRVLQGAGFAVETVIDGQGAMNRVLAGLAGLRLVLLDVVMPRLTGLEVLARIRALYPDLPVVLSSAVEVGDAGPSHDAHTRFLEKPYGPQTLLDVVDRALRAKPQTQGSPLPGNSEAASAEHISGRSPVRPPTPPGSELSSSP